MEIGFTMAGLRPSRHSWLQKQVNAVQSREDALKTKAKMLRSRYRMAEKYGDRGDVDIEREKIRQFQIDNPGHKVNTKGESLNTQQGFARSTEGVASSPWQKQLYDDWEVD